MKKLKKCFSLLLIFTLLLSGIQVNATPLNQEYSSDIINVIDDLDIETVTTKNDVLNSSSLTPLATKTKAIVIIPGILGSSLQNTSTGNDVWLNFINYGQMALNENGTSVNPIASINKDNYGANNTYKTLYNSLKSAYSSSFDVIFFDYDWRLNNTLAATKLATELSSYTQVVLVAHSMGGLVASRYLSNSAANRSKTAALITLGTPYVGSAKCINVMETGDLIGINILGINITLFGNTVKAVCKNSNASYQLLPTSKYYSITGESPISYLGTNYTASEATLKNTAWGKTSAGVVKTMFANATTFHNSLYNSSNVHVTNFSDVKTYTLAATAVNTISRVNLGSGYTITGLTYTNTGDGTVLAKSAGLGTPDYTYTGPDHTSMVSDSVVISRIKNIISSTTGVVATASMVAETSSLTTKTNFTTTEINSKDTVANQRGWLEGYDNRRINIYASDLTLSVDNMLIEEVEEYLYTSDGTMVGNVWSVGNSGKKLYALNNQNYDIVSSSDIRVEYMNDGYFDKIVDYKLGNVDATIEINEYTTKDLQIESKDSMAKQLTSTYSTYVYSNTELEELNQDR